MQEHHDGEAAAGPEEQTRSADLQGDVGQRVEVTRIPAHDIEIPVVPVIRHDMDIQLREAGRRVLAELRHLALVRHDGMRGTAQHGQDEDGEGDGCHEEYPGVMAPENHVRRQRDWDCEFQDRHRPTDRQQPSGSLRSPPLIMRDGETQMHDRLPSYLETFPHRRFIRHDDRTTTTPRGRAPPIPAQHARELQRRLVLQGKIAAVFDGGGAGGALVGEVAEQLAVVEVPEAVEIFGAAGDGGGDGAGGQDGGDHGALDAEGFGEEDDGGVGGDGEDGGEHWVFHILIFDEEG